MPEHAVCAAPVAWSEVARWVEASLGLHFPPPLWPDLERGLATAARRLGLAGAAACAERALAHRLGEDQQLVLAECLTIGETYFFRDAALLNRVATHVLQPLIAQRRRTTRHLRLWSAGCSSGEEPYSLAMLVASLLPDWRDWNISILATDVNPAALRKAQTGAYGPWSLRAGVPHRCRAFLQAGPDGQHRVDAELRARVHFAQLNLAGQDYPCAANLTTAMDLVLCRNVLIYFEPARARAVLERLGTCLVDAGWLVTGSVELPTEAIPGLQRTSRDGLFALRRCAAPQQPSPVAAVDRPGREALRPPPAVPPPSLLRQARERADAGDLPAAERLCRAAIAQDRLDGAPVYLLASILGERGACEEATAALHRTLYLQPDHLLARVALGSLALRQGDTRQARRHFALALARLERLPAESALPDGDGMTARELQQALKRSAGGLAE